MRTIGFIAVSALLAAFVAIAPARAAERVALVIANAEYENVSVLNNTVSDATAIASTLERLGFDVTIAHDQTTEGLRTTLGQFRREAAAAEVAVVFYAGHGIEVDQQNYLVPVDASLQTDADIEFEAVPLDLVLRSVEGASRLRLVMLDACRDNPFLRSMQRQTATRSIGRGLARVEPTGETLVAFAAREGTTASDGTAGDHSPYTQALLKYLEVPNLEIMLMFRKIRDEVLQSTNGVQEPFTYGSLSSREFYFVAADAGTETENIAEAVPGLSAEDSLWAAVERNGKVEAFQAYLDRFPNGKYADAASLWVDALSPAGQGDNGETEVASVNADQEILAENPPILECDRLTADPSDAGRVTQGVEWHAIEANAAIAACRRDTAAYPRSDRLSFQLARALHKGNQTPEAIPLYEDLASRSYIAAAVNLGLIYEIGKGVEVDYAKARKLFEIGADANNMNAHFQLGRLYQHGHGVDIDYVRAREYFQRAADEGDHLNAIFGLGYLYAQGLGVPEDQKLAFDYYMEAAERNHPGAVNNIGLRYLTGVVVQKDVAEGIRWMERAAGLGFSELMYTLGLLYGIGQDVPRDMNRAAEWIYKALAQADEFALKLVIENPGQTHSQFRRNLQQRLRDAGYYHGPIDGQFGSGTASAIRALAAAGGSNQAGSAQ